MCTKVKRSQKAKEGGDLFFFTHLTVERCPFLFIYLLYMPRTSRRVWRVECEHSDYVWCSACVGLYSLRLESVRHYDHMA